MEWLLALLFMFGMATFCMMMLTGYAFRRKESPVQRSARRFHGRVLKGAWFQPTGIEFQYTDTPVTVLVGHTCRHGSYIEAWMNWPHAKYQMLIVPAGRPVTRSSVRYLGTLDSVSDTFYWRYRVYTNNADIGRRIMNDAVKWNIEQLRALLSQTDVEIRWRHGRLMIRKYGSPRNATHWEQFIALALRLYDQAMLVVAEGIEFVTPEEATIVEDVRCQICGESITTDMVFCRMCRTPHHRECWEYNGSCSVFACRETQFVTPRLAAPPPGPR